LVFFSSRRRHTRFSRDWSSDVCSSDLEEFRTKIAEDAFVEYEEVYSGLYYGTLKSEVERIWNAGKTVIFDVDVKGGISLKSYFEIGRASCRDRVKIYGYGVAQHDIAPE